MEYLITFPTTHNMLKGEAVLKEQEIPFRSMPLPASLGDSCGFCLRLWENELEDGLCAMKHNQVQINDVYTIENTDGKRVYLKCT